MRQELIEEYRLEAHHYVANEIAKAKFRMQTELDQKINALTSEISSKLLVSRQ